MSLPTTYIDEIKQILESISAKLPGYVPRQSQKRMIAAVAEVLSRAGDAEKGEAAKNTGRCILCVQGPTGVGKSLGYLIGGAVAAQDKKRKLVVSSATVALQEQLVERDVPFFIKNTGLPLSYALAKGRTRYACHRKLAMLAMEQAQDSLFEGEALWERKPEEGEVRMLGELLARYESKKWSGDRDELKDSISDDLWSRITTDRHGCLNRGCQSYSVCAQMSARQRVRDADIIIANHDLLLADLAMGGGVVLPEPEETFYILDEGHHIAAKAVESFSGRHQVSAARAIMEKLSQAVLRVGQSFPSMSVAAGAISDSAIDLSGSMVDVFQMLDGIDKAVFEGNGNLWRFDDNRLPDGADVIASNIINVASDLNANLSALLEELSEMKKEGSNDARLDKFLADLGFFKGRIEAIHKTWTMLAMDGTDETVPVAKWVVLESKKGSVKYDFSVCASPVSAAAPLVEMFFERAGGVILTSATLMTMGNFDQLLRETGLECLPDTALLALPSPFNFAEQGVLSIPEINASPKDAAKHTKAIVTRLPELVEQTGKAGTLVLFTSRKQMMEVADGIPATLRKQLLIQGERSKSVLLDEHRRRIDGGKASVLFGLQSFAEGMDLPGAYCSHVIITKIPFAVPSDPVQQTLEEWLAKMGKSYFDEIALPQACLRMVQWSGRLIRTEKDHGMLTVLDERLRKTGYGRRIKECLPPFRMAA